MEFYENIANERGRIQTCLNRFGHTSDHNLDWWTCAINSPDGKPVFVQWPDGTGLMTHRYPDAWRIWSDPLAPAPAMALKIADFAQHILDNETETVWCDYVAQTIRSELLACAKNDLIINQVYYSLFWPVLDMFAYDSSLSGNRLKELRNARNKFYREHKLTVVPAATVPIETLRGIVDKWKKLRRDQEDTFDLWYRRAIDRNFAGFETARALLVDGVPVAINAGYTMINNPARFVGIIGLHDYSVKDLGIISYLEDFDWIKNAGYRELDMQGSEKGIGLEFKLRFGATVERTTDTFSVQKK